MVLVSNSNGCHYATVPLALLRKFSRGEAVLFCRQNLGHMLSLSRQSCVFRGTRNKEHEVVELLSLMHEIFQKDLFVVACRRNFVSVANDNLAVVLCRYLSVFSVNLILSLI